MRSGGRFGVVTSVRLLVWKTDSRGQCRAIWTWVPAERAEAYSVAGRKNWPGTSAFLEAHRPWIIGDRLLTGNSRVPASEKRHLQFFRVFLNALLCGPWGTRVWVAAERICLWRVSVSSR